MYVRCLASHYVDIDLSLILIFYKERTFETYFLRRFWPFFFASVEISVLDFLAGAVPGRSGERGKRFGFAVHVQ